MPQQHMIALYYCYPPGGIRPSDLKRHVDFHRETCQALSLGGRVRVSEEGINGVSSGTEENLREYERLLRKELLALVDVDIVADTDGGQGAVGEDHDDDRGDDPTVEWLDVKYCRLREDVPAEKQLFDSLSVKITREVVSLIERPADENNRNNKGGNNKKGRARCRQRRKQRRKEKQRLEKLLQRNGECAEEGGSDPTVGDDRVAPTMTIVGEPAAAAEAPGSSSPLDERMESLCIEQNPAAAMTSANGGDAAASEIGTALPIRDWERREPAAHLSPQRWNEELLKLSSRQRGGGDRDRDVGEGGGARPDGPPPSEASGTDPCADADDNAQELLPTEEDDDDVDSDAVLLDARNVYETRVGHFAVPGLETFFPNTRKFSSLPNALNTEEAARALAGKKVFMYCTGGVRCERAGSYLRALAESDSGAWKGRERPRGIYQLRGGIQKYLESYGEEPKIGEGIEGGGGSLATTTMAEDTVVDANGSSEDDGTATTTMTGNCRPRTTEGDPCLYRGKNFVFDPRRTDPVIGRGSGGESLVGRCVVCSTPHDDYDNGRAPCEGKEARCRRCRMLVLVCDGCRRRVRCWGEEGEFGDDDDGGRDWGGKTDLFCGPGGRDCVDEGNVAAKVETARF